MQSSLKLGVILAVACPLVVAQTFSDCNPMKKSCRPNPALCSNFESDFTKGSSALSGWKTTAGALTYGPDGTQFTISKRGDAPTIQTDDYLFFGYVEVKMKPAAGTGIISSIVLESDDLDEVDFEFIGGENTNVQTNYFGKGNTTTYDRMVPYNVQTPQQMFHTYAVNWTQEAIVWLIDGVAVRTLNFADAVGGINFPQTPMNVRIGIWAGGDKANDPGTITWAGGQTDYTKVPFTMTVESVKIMNYNPGLGYQYSDQSGSFKSIKTVPGTCGAASTSPQGSPNSSPGGFYPVSNSSSSMDECTMATVTTYVTAESQGTPTPSQVLSSAVPTPYQTPSSSGVPSSIIVDTGTPNPPSSLPLPTGNGTVPSPSPSQFTGAATKVGGLDGPQLAIALMFGVLLSVLAF